MASKRTLQDNTEFFHSLLRLCIILLVANVLLYIGIKLYHRIINKNLKKLTNKSVILITGACQGIGRELALLFGKLHKCIIVCWDIRDDLAPKLRKLYL